MKVLWFTNTPANADEFYNIKLAGTGGWLKSLNKVLQEEVDLHIAYYYKSSELSSFVYEKTHYHPIKKNRNFKIALKKAFNIVMDSDDLELYLKIIRLVNPDIIHIHGTENAFGCIIGKTDIPTVVSIQGNATVYNRKYYSGIDSKYMNVRKFSLIPRNFLHSFRRDKMKFKQMAIREQKHMEKCEYIIGRTDWDRRISRILSPRSKYYHNDEILRGLFYSNTWQYLNNTKVILHTTTGGSYYKGFETICEVASLLNKLGFIFEWRIAGLNENDMIVKVVKSMLKENYPTKGIVFLDKVDENQLIKYMLEANIYIMTSHIENSPNNLCEAMILGMPCIATYVGGTSSLMKNGIEGILIQDGDPWVLAGTIIELSESRDFQHEFSVNARERALRRHNPLKISQELLKIYETIIKQRNVF